MRNLIPQNDIFDTEKAFDTPDASPWVTITASRRSVLNFMFLHLTFLRSMSCSMCIEQKVCKVKIFKLQSTSSEITCIDKGVAVKNSGIQEFWYIISGLDMQLHLAIVAWG